MILAKSQASLPKGHEQRWEKTKKILICSV
jgi:hypothetical protein